MLEKVIEDTVGRMDGKPPTKDVVTEQSRATVARSDVIQNPDRDTHEEMI